MHPVRPLLLTICLAPCLPGAAQQSQLINSFESDEELRHWEIRCAEKRLTAEGATHGQKALELELDPRGEWAGATMFWYRVLRDWSDYDVLVVDVFNPNDFPLASGVLIGDEAWQKKPTYWNRHNGQTTFAPGKSLWMIPVRGLFRGEAGSRNNDLKTDIDPKTIVRLDLSFGSKGQSGRVILDNIRLVKSSRPVHVWAFDFGPPSQSVMPGWTAVSNQTRFAPDTGYGWWPPGALPWDGAARDTTFGTMLTQDFCEAGGYNFRVAVARGEYEALVIFENCGYWGGEQARHRWRRILVEGKPVWSEQRPDGAQTFLHRFENVEPIGADIWQTYMLPEITRPVRFRATAGDDGLTLRFEADVGFGSRVSALALYPAHDATAKAWLDGQLQALADEFRGKAVLLDLPLAAFAPPANWQQKGFVAWPVKLEETITPNSLPAAAPAPAALRLSAVAARGEFEPLALAVRPQRDLGECTLALDWEGAALPATVRVVRYNTRRDFSNIAYHIAPHTLREAASVALPANVTRQFVVTVRVPADANAGEHRARLKISDAAGKELLSVPLTVRVRDVALLRDTEFLMGYFGLMPPWDGVDRERALEQTLTLLRDYGMNALCVDGVNLRLTGWRDGQPQIDFSEVDRFFALARKHGFDRPMLGYGGLRFVGLHEGYQKGGVAAQVAKNSGLSYEEAFGRAWEAVDRHARAHRWPTILYGMCDETRVREVAEREIEFMKLMAKVTAKFPQTVRAQGSYSVHYQKRPTDPADMLYWEQRFFETLDISSLNLHDPTVLDEARRLGKEVHIYNQGVSRYSFGLYAWSEFQKGVRALWQWHLNALHGYQFFDLDGREPDMAMICYGRNGIYPTMDFERCREGAEDFYLYQTLHNAVQANQRAGRKLAETKAAAELLNSITASIALNQRTPPAGFDADALKLKIIAAIESLR